MNTVIPPFASGAAGAPETEQIPARYLNPRLGMLLHLLAWAMALSLLSLVVIPEDPTPLHTAYRLTAILVAATVLLFCSLRLKLPRHGLAMLCFSGAPLIRNLRARFVSREIPWHRYSLRSLMLFVTVACAILGYLTWYLRPRLEYERAAAEIRANAGNTWGIPSRGARSIVWVEFYGTDADLQRIREHLETLPGLQRLYCRRALITDKALGHLGGFERLELLDLTDTRVTDTGLQYLKDVPKLAGLDLRGTRITDAGLEHLGGVRSLVWVDLTGTQVTDTGLKHLEALPRLEWVNACDTNVTDAGAEKLQRALPDCVVRRSLP